MHRLPTGGNVKNALKSFQKPHFRYGQCTLDIKLRKLKKDETPRTAEALESVWQEQCPSGRPLVKVHRSGWNSTQEAHNSGTRCDGAVKGGKEVGGEHETEATEILEHIRGMATYFKLRTGLVLSFAQSWRLVVDIN